MSLYLASTATTIVPAATTTFPNLLPPPPIDLRRLERGMSLPMPPAPPPPSLVATNNRYLGTKHKAIVVLGATGTGKSRLAVDLALTFDGEVINADKIQVHAGLDVATNKVTDAERAGVPHHLLGVVPPDAEFTAADFRRDATRVAGEVTARGRVPIVAGGSNSFIEELVDGGDRRAFREVFDLCFLWVDVCLPVLHVHVARRVDEMRRRGMVDEVAAAFDPRRVDYTRGVWRAIGAPELDAYLRWSGHGGEGERARLLEEAMEEIKSNTRRLACRQRGKIQRLARTWRVRRVDATEVFRRRGGDADEAWRRLVAAPCIEAVRSFLNDEDDDDEEEEDDDLLLPQVVPVFAPTPAAAAAVAV
ncbi:hypothetical protein HU200_040794 [Digitaria exilis]|uniref:adenylate dimethylallyltransferase (ADP/ATP-dependent) n=1 Tax=Digitaria exilis TaxID=1010633 RepID=A0A835EI38_9POAL|nr:hypothetical protein HU200_040794 [Digitaria exilis]CAB3452357.1 unnamed protein product [Digitaria exilis]